MKKTYAFLKNFFLDYYRLDGFNLSAALSFYLILSLLPILLIIVSLLGHYLGQSQVFMQNVSELLSLAFPSAKDIFFKNLFVLVQRKEALGSFGILCLFSLAHFTLTNLESILNRVLGSTQKRHFLITRLLFLVWMSAVAVALSIPSLLRMTGNLFTYLKVPYHFSLAISGGQIFFLLLWLSFIMLLHFIPKRSLPKLRVAQGGLFFAIFIHLANALYKEYLDYAFSQYNLIFGSLTFLILGALWIYYASNLFLLCALWVGKKH